MANADAPRGFAPRSSNGLPWCGQVNEYFIDGGSDATATFIGDLVKLSGSAETDGTPHVEQAAATNAVVGVVVGFRPDPDNQTRNWRVASTDRYVLVADDPNQVFEAQEDSDGAALAVTDTSNNINVIVGSGSTTTGLSGMELDSSSVNTTATLPIKLLRMINREDNAIGNQAQWLVKINNHQYGSHTGTAGV